MAGEVTRDFIWLQYRNNIVDLESDHSRIIVKANDSRSIIILIADIEQLVAQWSSKPPSKDIGVRASLSAPKVFVMNYARIVYIVKHWLT